jgi:ribosomal protein L37AE/L43A
MSDGRDAGVPCTEDKTGDHVLRYAEGGWYCWRCFASLRLGVWHPVPTGGDTDAL